MLFRQTPEPPSLYTKNKNLLWKNENTQKVEVAKELKWHWAKLGERKIHQQGECHDD